MTESQAKRAFQFYNCDELKTIATMNPYYNTTIYRDYKTSRQLLWKDIKTAVLINKAVEIDIENMAIVKDLILNGNPSDANDYMKYGVIVSYEIV